ncbi:MAG TPA: hypothetical protein VJ203_06095 [Bacteroidales bacterium]|nr:hypothetical protein [Bacteroidales bacterium]
MEPDNLPRALEAVQKAKALSVGSTQKEKDLIDALISRYSDDPDIARSVLDSSYASRMRLVYLKYPHNCHFLAACGALAGESENAMLGAYETKNHAYEKLLLDPYWTTLQHFYSIPMFVQVKLGKWKEIQNYPEPEKELKYPRVIWHYSRGMAALASDRTGLAGKHLREMKSIMQDSALKTYTIWGINRLYDICRIASSRIL